MWIFAKDGFLSIKQHDLNPALLVVRGRVRGDIQRLMAVRQVTRDDTADYLFRAFIDRNVVADKIAAHVRAINYGGAAGGFKSQIRDKRRYWAYADVWGRMQDLQWELSGEQRVARRSE